MAEYLSDDCLIKRETLEGIADALRTVSETSDKIPAIRFREIILEYGSKSLGTPTVLYDEPDYCTETIEIGGVTGQGYLYLVISGGTVAGISETSTIEVMKILGNAFGYSNGAYHRFTVVVYDPATNMISEPTVECGIYIYFNDSGESGNDRYLAVYGLLANVTSDTKTHTIGFLVDGEEAVAYSTHTLNSTSQTGILLASVRSLDSDDTVKIYTSHSSGAGSSAVTATGYDCTVVCEMLDSSYSDWIITVSGIGLDSYVTITFDHDN